MDDWKELEEYARDNSEAAFNALVTRHLNFVYSAALRQVNQDSQLAEEVTQAVFILLAWKARGFGRDVLLPGWLHRTTRFVASRALRSEIRRQHREQEAGHMQSLHSADDNWKRIAPVLDEALAALGESERAAVLLRFFQDKNLRETGESLGISEDAAKKRVARGVDKLRGFFERRGFKISVVALTAALAAHSVQAAPVTMAGVIGSTAFASAANATTGLPMLVKETLAAWRWAKLKIAGASLAAGIALFMTMSVALQKPAEPVAPRVSLQKLSPALPTKRAQRSAMSARRLGPVSTLIFHVVAADTGEPVPKARLAINTVFNRDWKQTYDWRTDGSGKCVIPFPPSVTRLDVGVLSDGWQARYVTWVPSRDDLVPSEYTLRVQRTTNSIGGVLRDELGKPIANAEIYADFSNTGSLSNMEMPRENHGFIWHALLGRSDREGRWHSAVISLEHDAEIQAEHPDFCSKTIGSTGAQASLAEISDDARKELWNGTRVTVMQRGLVLRGRVLTETGDPIPDASITEGIQRPVFKTDFNGEFQVPKLERGSWEFSVTAEGYAPERRTAQIAANMSPLEIRMKPGALLKLRAIDEKGEPVEGARIGMEQWADHRQEIDFTLTTDADGRVESKSLPANEELELYAQKDGFCYTRNIKLEADGEEHVIEMRHTLAITGRVTDVETGEAIPEVKAIPGYGDAREWERLSTRHGTNGNFKIVFEENQLPWRVRIEAEGYAPFISDPINTNSTETSMNVAMRKLTEADSIRGMVIFPDGSPAAGVQVALSTLETETSLTGTKLSTDTPQTLTKANAQGEFVFEHRVAAIAVTASSPEGCAHVRLKAPGQKLQLQLQPWGRIEGVVRVKAKPGEKLSLHISPAVSEYSAVEFSQTFEWESDSHFQFEQVPPGEVQLELFHGAGKAITHFTSVQVKAGETTTVEIADPTGNRVSGRIVEPADLKINWTTDIINASLTPNQGAPPSPQGLSPEANWQWQADFWESEEGRARLRANHGVILKVSEDGSFSSAGVKPGKYSLHVLVLQNGGSQIVAMLSKDVTIPDTAVADPLATSDLGEAKLPKTNQTVPR